MELIGLVGSVAGGAGGGIGSALGLASAGLGLVGSMAAASAQEKQAKAQAAEMERQANQEHVARVRKAQEHQRQGKIMLSRQEAVSGSSGAGSAQPNTVEGIIKYSTANAMAEAGLGQQAMNNAAASAANTISAGKSNAMQTRLAGVGNFMGSLGKVMGGAGSMGGRPSTSGGGWQTTVSYEDPEWKKNLWSRFG